MAGWKASTSANRSAESPKTWASKPKRWASTCGLGLAIARSDMQPHRGVVAARNRSGGGLVFSLCLPRG
ncbi:MAG: hypothetical protein JNK59_04860 [Sterolibacteriaceae bacterium]|nr:hypothetical protein [Sterolibacteriaceae bacterium]